MCPSAQWPSFSFLLIQSIAEVLLGCGGRLAGLEFEASSVSPPPRKSTASTSFTAPSSRSTCPLGLPPTFKFISHHIDLTSERTFFAQHSTPTLTDTMICMLGALHKNLFHSSEAAGKKKTVLVLLEIVLSLYVLFKSWICKN